MIAVGWCGPTKQIGTEYNKWTEQVKNPDWQEADQLVCTSTAEGLNLGLPCSNPASGQSGTWTNHSATP